ncbi:MAG: hypothetical protein GC179_29730 [Anaerolineaceae bacterium]|nr:hypothetical protein [Anaerolineaceae bacterium]
MPNTILVTYASRTGSTVGVAEAIGKRLTENGLQAAVLPMTEVKDLSLYSAVVAGSAIQDKKWLPEAMTFMHTYRNALLQKPFAAFLVCMTLAMEKGDYRNAVIEWLSPVRALVKPVSEGYFAGVLDISKIPSFSARLNFRISVALGVWTEGDHRDWTAIRSWANNLTSKP